MPSQYEEGIDSLPSWSLRTAELEAIIKPSEAAAGSIFPLFSSPTALTAIDVEHLVHLHHRAVVIIAKATLVTRTKPAERRTVLQNGISLPWPFSCSKGLSSADA